MNNSALLVMDYQIDILKNVESKAKYLLANTSALLAAARKSNTPIFFVKVGFRDGYPEVSNKNKMFSWLKEGKRMLLANPGTEIHPGVAPQADEYVIIKHRVGPFLETDLLTILRAQQISHLVLAGISTSGVVLSSVRYAADLDFSLTVVSDACADGDEEVHRLLMEKVFPRQAEVIKTEAALALFA